MKNKKIATAAKWNYNNSTCARIATSVSRFIEIRRKFCGSGSTTNVNSNVTHHIFLDVTNINTTRALAMSQCAVRDRQHSRKPNVWPQCRFALLQGRRHKRFHLQSEKPLPIVRHFHNLTTSFRPRLLRGRRNILGAEAQERELIHTFERTQTRP